MPERHVLHRRVHHLMLRALSLALAHPREPVWVELPRVGPVRRGVGVCWPGGGADERAARDDDPVAQRYVSHCKAAHARCFTPRAYRYEGAQISTSCGMHTGESEARTDANPVKPLRLAQEAIESPELSHGILSPALFSDDCVDLLPERADILWIGGQVIQSVSEGLGYHL